MIPNVSCLLVAESKGPFLPIHAGNKKTFLLNILWNVSIELILV